MRDLLSILRDCNYARYVDPSRADAYEELQNYVQARTQEIRDLLPNIASLAPHCPRCVKNYREFITRALEHL